MNLGMNCLRLSVCNVSKQASSAPVNFLRIVPGPPDLKLPKMGDGIEIHIKSLTFLDSYLDGHLAESMDTFVSYRSVQKATSGQRCALASTESAIIKTYVR